MSPKKSDTKFKEVPGSENKTSNFTYACFSCFKPRQIHNKTTRGGTNKNKVNIVGGRRVDHQSSHIFKMRVVVAHIRKKQVKVARKPGYV
jgi:hypothetical protein